MRIEDIIPIGKNYAISRRNLSEIMGVSDRQVRREIAEARKNGTVIINLQRGDGYYKPGIYDTAELIYYTRQEDHRIREAAKALNACKRLLKERGYSIKNGVIIYERY